MRKMKIVPIIASTRVPIFEIATSSGIAKRTANNTKIQRVNRINGLI